MHTDNGQLKLPGIKRQNQSFTGLRNKTLSFKEDDNKLDGQIKRLKDHKKRSLSLNKNIKVEGEMSSISNPVLPKRKLNTYIPRKVGDSKIKSTLYYINL
jgi:hypothetical protein